MFTKEPHRLLSDDAFEARFEAATLPPDVFTHEAHLRLAWIHLRKYGEGKAIRHITSQLQQYVQQLGASAKYHETLTIAAIKAVWHFMQKNPAATFDDFITKNEKLKTNFKDIINQHYSSNVVQTAAAKRRFVAPDLLPFT